jgi:hypothetical protein
VGVLGHGLLEAVGDNLAHGGGGDVLVGGSSRGSGALVLLDILLGDLTTTTGTLQSLDGDTLLEGKGLGGRADGSLTVQARLELVTRSLGLDGGGLRGRGRGRLSALGLFLLLGGRGSLVTTGISQGELCESGDISALLDEDSNGL